MGDLGGEGLSDDCSKDLCVHGRAILGIIPIRFLNAIARSVMAKSARRSTETSLQGRVNPSVVFVGQATYTPP